LVRDPNLLLLFYAFVVALPSKSTVDVFIWELETQVIDSWGKGRREVLKLKLVFCCKFLQMLEEEPASSIKQDAKRFWVSASQIYEEI
jgi:hypothetical protein